MRLIDADALKTKLNNNLFFEVFWEIYHAPAIDAIPVSFLELLRDNARSAEAAETITEILRLWDKEAKG